jgi:hypothetical protein
MRIMIRILMLLILKETAMRGDNADIDNDTNETYTERDNDYKG